MNYEYDVIIIGAGISGLVAAHTILDKEPSLDILILEAKDRIGGRTLSLPVTVQGNNTCLFDFGGHWVSRSQNHVMKYLKLVNLNVVPQQRGVAIAARKEDSFETYNDSPIIGNVFTSYEIKWFFGLLEEQSAMYQFSGKQNRFIKEFYDSISMEYYINSKMYTGAAKKITKNMIKSITGVEPSQISVLYYLLLCNSCLGFTNQYMNKDGGARELWIEEGAFEICNRLKDILGNECLVLNEPVTEINYSRPDHVTLKTFSGKKYIGTHVISAIPPEQVLEINFNPPLSQHKKLVLQESHIGHIAKFVITYNTPFWRFHGYSGEIFACEGGPINICYDATKDDYPALTGYIKEPFNSFRGELGFIQTDTVISISAKLTNQRFHKIPISFITANFERWLVKLATCTYNSVGLNEALIYIQTDTIINTSAKLTNQRFHKIPFSIENGTCETSVVKQLKKYWGKDALEYIEYKEYIWWDEPYVGGCPMTCIGVNTAKWYYLMTQPTDRIHWAGTETATEWNGYMNGAIQSGYRAAINLLYNIRPQCLNVEDIVFIESRRTHVIRLKNFHLGKTSTILLTLLSTYLVYKHVIKKYLK